MSELVARQTFCVLQGLQTYCLTALQHTVDLVTLHSAKNERGDRYQKNSTIDLIVAMATKVQGSLCFIPR